MSVTKISPNPETLSKRRSHRTEDSCELDVFEATKYFSGFEELSAIDVSATQPDKHSIVTDSKLKQRIMNVDVIPANHHRRRTQIGTRKERKQRQPSSPGGRLASFFINTLFGQMGSKKKTSKSAMESQKGQAADKFSILRGGHEDEKRKRRSSTSHSQSSTDSSSKSPFSSSISSGFRTPPIFIDTYTNRSKSRSIHNHKQVVLKNESLKATIFLQNNNDQRRVWVRDHKDLLEKSREDKDTFDKKIEESAVDDGGESDSSSDLFELPVCATTSAASIKSGVVVSTDGKL